MNRTEAANQYNSALKLGQKCRKNAVLHGQYPYLQVLDELIDDSMIAGQVDLGVVEVPAERIVGTKVAGRTTAFASNFMPLLEEDTEFGMKWISLCMAHLSDEGIREPVQCYEYLGRFYVQEGNKRVSVLRSYQASTIPCRVTRLIPAASDDPQIKIYFEFMEFYRLTGLYQTSFTQPGSGPKLQAALGFAPGHVWTNEDRAMFLARYSRFRDFYRKQGGEQLESTVADAMLVWLGVYPFAALKDMVASQLSQSIASVWPDILLLSQHKPLEINTEPVEQPEERGLLGHLLGTRQLSHLNVAFLFQDDPAVSAFTRSHELGAQYVEEQMADRITVRRYYDVKNDESGEWIAGKAVAEGAQVLIATAPPMIGLCRRMAARYPDIKILDCALSMAYSGVRTYYSRVYEAKFITGAIAAAMAKENVLGYVANYPILGVPAGINAFALGARMVNPEMRIHLEWSCTPGDPYEGFTKNGVKVITNREIPSPEATRWSWDWGTYRRKADGSMLPLASPCWNWGAFYEKVLTSILNGAWDQLGSADGGKAVSYWWGMDSGVIDVQMNPDLPEGVQTLGRVLKRGVVDGTLDPFGFRLVDQQGQVRCDGEKPLQPQDIMRMNYLCEFVDGAIPHWDELIPKARNVVRVLGVYRDEIPPEKEGVLL